MRLRAAVAGLAHNHIFGFLEKAESRGIEVVGAAEPDPGLRAAANDRGIACVDLPAEELFQTTGADIAVIGAPYGDRGELALAALRAGLHVLADKPLCTDREELRAIRREAAERNRTVGIMLDLTDRPAFRTAVDAARRGMIGKINNIVFEGQHPLMHQTRQPWYFEEGRWGGVFNDIAIHAADLAEKLTGSAVNRVIAARSWNFYANAAPHFKDSGQVMFTTGSGCGVMGDVSYAAPDSWGYGLPSYWHIRAWGESGMMEFSVNLPEVTVYISGENKARILMGEPEGPDYLEHFLTAVQDSKYRRTYTEQMLHIQETALAMQESADEEKESSL